MSASAPAGHHALQTAELRHFHAGSADLGSLLADVFGDVSTWIATPAEERDLLRAPHAYAARRALLDRLEPDRTLSPALETLAGMLLHPVAVTETAVAYACLRVAEWAEARGRAETAALFRGQAAQASPVVARAWVGGHARAEGGGHA